MSVWAKGGRVPSRMVSPQISRANRALVSETPSENIMRKIIALLPTRWDEHTLDDSNMF